MYYMDIMYLLIVYLAKREYPLIPTIDITTCPILQTIKYCIF